MTENTFPAATSVLVVEDDFLVRSCAVEFLSDCGFTVLEAADAPDAMAILEGAQVDVVFTDVNMPGAFDGLDLARRISHRWPHMAVVITSGRGCPDVEGTCARFLPKPYMLDTLTRLITEEAGHHAKPDSGRLAG